MRYRGGGVGHLTTRAATDFFKRDRHSLDHIRHFQANTTLDANSAEEDVCQGEESGSQEEEEAEGDEEVDSESDSEEEMIEMDSEEEMNEMDSDSENGEEDEIEELGFANL